jgi:AICAR transformylase/IMP cyclohydrolase PurH
MKLSKNTIAATVAAIVIGGLSISPAAAKVHENGRVPTASDNAGFTVSGDVFYNNGRTAPEGTKPILRSTANGKTNGRQG